MNCEIQKTLKIDKKLSLWTGCDEGDAYNVLCIEQSEIFDYYLQKAGYGDLMHICRLEKPIDLPEYFIVKHIDIAIKNNFWRD